MTEPLFSCQVQACAEEVSLTADMLKVYEGKPICEPCCEFDSETPDWEDLEPFVPEYKLKIIELEQTISDLRMEIITNLGEMLEIRERAIEEIATWITNNFPHNGKAMAEMLSCEVGDKPDAFQKLSALLKEKK